MLVGYNTNISYREKIYHIQTEDNGLTNPVVVTLLYSKGAILASKKTSYAHILHEADSTQEIRNLMREQHKDMIKELLAGKYEGGHEEEATEREEMGDIQREPAEPLAERQPEEICTAAANEKDEAGGAKDQISKSLDDILLNYIMRRTKQ